jgi:Domain of unknown function (DUF3387)
MTHRRIGVTAVWPTARGEKLGLSEDELAFYDALETNDSAVNVLGDETLRTIARDAFQGGHGEHRRFSVERRQIARGLRRMGRR